MTQIDDAQTAEHVRRRRRPHALPLRRTEWISARGEPPAKVTVTWGVDADDTTTVDLTGELCVLTARRVNDLFDSIAERSASDVAFDMSEVTFIDCRGVSLFLHAQERLAERGLRCRVVSPSHVVRRLFALVDLEDRLVGRFHCARPLYPSAATLHRHGFKMTAHG